MRKLLICLLLLSGPTLARADYPPLQGRYDEPDNHAADVIASSMAVMPALAAIGMCGMLTLPADAYWKVRRPEVNFGTHVANRVCPYPGAAVGNSIYLVGGFPFFAGQKIVGTLRARTVGAGQ